MLEIIAEKESPAAGGFAIPEGFTLPEETKEGDTFEALITLRLGPGGMVVPAALDGIPIASAPVEPVVEEEMAEDAPFVDRVEKMSKPLNPDKQASLY